MSTRRSSYAELVAIVEELTLQVDAGDLEGFLEADARIWTAFLAVQPGFVRKEVWVPADRSNTVVILLWWASREQWKAISDETIASVDRDMGEWFREPAVREYLVAR
jgi:uncharacterized protein (TIGR03792 family)